MPHHQSSLHADESGEVRVSEASASKETGEGKLPLITSSRQNSVDSKEGNPVWQD